MKDFAPYEPSLELRELGFNEPCFGYYEPNGDLDYIEKHILKDFPYLAKNSEWQDLTSAPTFSQAFRWFREKYNIQGYIYSSTVRGNSEKTKQFTGYIWNINGIDMPFISTDARDELHDTYEEAELACLQKLIEIVKDEKKNS